MYHPLCGFSMQKAAKFIAIFDVVLCCIYVLSHFVGGGYIYEKQYEQYQSELSNMLTQDEPLTTTENPNPNAFSMYFLSYEDYRKLETEHLPSVDIVIVLGLCAAAFSIVHICMEVWLCRLLLKAAAHKDGGACKTWFWCRLGVTTLFTLYSLVGILTVTFDFVDYICEAINIYRIYTLIIIYEFKKEISASVSMTIIKPR